MKDFFYRGIFFFIRLRRVDISPKADSPSAKGALGLLMGCSIILFFSCLPGLAQSSCQKLIVESKYFAVYGDEDFNITSFLSRLHFDYFLHLDNILGASGPQKGAGTEEKTILTKTMDAIFLEVSDILAIHMYSFQGTIKVMRDRDEVNRAFKKIFKRDFGERSFYLHPQNILYISFADLTLGMLGHEIAHAIMAHYFVVPPPVKIQEVLSGYVEYNLRKSTGTLPKPGGDRQN